MTIAAGETRNIKELFVGLIEILEGLERETHGKEEKESGAVQTRNKHYL